VTATGEIPAGNEEVKELLDRCLGWSEIVLDRLVLSTFHSFFSATNFSIEKGSSQKHSLQNTRY
jgi:hypothetical protein